MRKELLAVFLTGFLCEAYAAPSSGGKAALNDQLAFSVEKAWVENKPSILASNQQTMTVRGTVTDQAGMPVIGANIVVKGSSTGTITDFDGKYTVKN